jgi:hypothetical protein
MSARDQRLFFALAEELPDHAVPTRLGHLSRAEAAAMRGGLERGISRLLDEQPPCPRMGSGGEYCDRHAGHQGNCVALVIW